jgi:hypothetical protein
VAEAALQVFAGPRARAWLRERGLRPGDVRALPAAAGGPKGLVLLPLDRLLFGHWLRAAPAESPPLHLLGASIGAWRMASACLADPDAALVRLGEDYITQTYEHQPGKPPRAAHVSAVFGASLGEHFRGREHEILRHPRWRLHVFTSHGRHLLARQGRWRTPLGYAGAFLGNALHRRALGGWLERVVFSDPRDALPLPLADLRGQRVALSAANLQPAVLASCSIPFWLDGVHDIPGGPRGAYWDGGITDYHLHLDYAAIADGIVLYPHFQPQVVPGWLDKPWKRRHRASRRLDNLVVLAPHPDWVRTLPGRKLPDRGDFKAFGDDGAGRQRAWRRALAESQRLAQDFDRLARQDSVQALPLP